MNRFLPLILIATACTPILESPTPSLEGVTPALVCNDQFITTVTVDGAQMTPVPKGILTEDPALDIPALWIERVLNLDGSASEDATLALDPTTRWLSNDVMEFDVDPDQLDFTVGVHDLFVRNLDAQVATTGEAISVAPPPTVSAIVPNLLCVDQAAKPAVLSGDDFLDVQGTLPVITVGPIDLPADALRDCFDLAGPVPGRSCDTADLTFPEDSLVPGVYDITLTNPETAQCNSVELLQIEIVPPPELHSFVPDLTCIDQADRVYTLTGANFLRLADQTLPTVAVGTYTALADSAQFCTPLTGPAGGDLCTELTYTLPQDIMVAGVYDIVVTNPPPADCISTEAVQVEIVPQPTVTEIEPTDYPTDDPEGTCLEQGVRGFELTGTGFIELADFTPPIVSVGSHVVPAVDTIPSNCTLLTGPAGGSSCTTLSIVLPQDATGVGVHDVVVTNPMPADCYSEEAIVLEDFPRPTLASIDATLVCDDAVSNTFTVAGGDFYVVGTDWPAITIGSYTAQADSGTCSAWGGPGADQVCTDLALTVNAGDLGTGLLPVSVENPGPLGCTTTESVDLEVLGAPTVTALLPPGSCNLAVDVDVTISGSGFLQLDTGELPAVDIAGNVLFPVATGACNTPLTGALAGDLCDTLDVTIPADTFNINDDYEFTIVNPSPADCGVTAVFSYSNPPNIVSTDPPQICLDPTTGFTLEIYGTDFTVNSQIIIDGNDIPTTFNDDTHLTGTVAAGTLTEGLYDITVDNAGGTCADTATGVLEITELPILFFVDPQIVPNVIPVSATGFVSGINDDVVDVTIEEAGTGVLTVVPFRWSATEPAVIEFDIPANLPEGEYHLRVTDDTGCEPELLNAFYIEADTDLTITAIDPPYGWELGVTPVEITSTGLPPFLDTPRVYLSPVVPGPTTTADELRAVSYVDDDTTDAVVPAGLNADLYDVIVVNPSTGEVGVLFGGFEVLVEEPPTIRSIAPGTIPTDVTPVTLSGTGFGTFGVDPEPVVELDCYDPTGDQCTVQGTGTFQTLPNVPVTSWDSNTIVLSVDGGAVGGGVCTVKVTKPSDSTEAEFAALSITNPSQNLYDWRSGTLLTTPRMQLMAAAGRATRTRRFLYAIGGDNGTQVLDSIERSRVDQFGDLGPWSLLPDPLPNPLRSAATIKIGRYIYLLGGHNGADPVDTVWRAQIMDPLAAPRFTTNLSVVIDPVGLPMGTFIYRVAALFDPADDDNPGGESLPSDPFVVRLPDLYPDNLQLTLDWTAVPDVIGYRIYRSSTTGGEEFLFDKMLPDPLDPQPEDHTYTDLGTPTDPLGPKPKPSGSLGEWSAMPGLAAPREAPCAGWGLDPLDDTVAYLFVAGGHDGTAARADIEYLDIDLNGELDQDAGGWTTSAEVLSGGRYECGGFSVTQELSSRIAPDDTWIYFGGGNGDNNTDVGRIANLGDFGVGDFYQGVNGPTNEGYGYATASNFIYGFGGTGPVATGKSGEICGTGQTCNSGPPDPPEVRNWNGLGVSMCESRIYMGSTQESSVIFAIGGFNGTAPTRTVDFTNY